MTLTGVAIGGTVDFEVSIDISAPARVVWSVMSDVERWHEWTPSIRGIRLLTSGPFRVGSRALVRQPRFPPALWTVTALEPERSFTWKSGGPGMWVHGHHLVEPIGSGTRARATLRLHFEGALGRLLGRMTRRITERYVGWEAAGLKRRSEESAAVHAMAGSGAGRDQPGDGPLPPTTTPR